MPQPLDRVSSCGNAFQTRSSGQLGGGNAQWMPTADRPWDWGGADLWIGELGVHPEPKRRAGKRGKSPRRQHCAYDTLDGTAATTTCLSVPAVPGQPAIQYSIASQGSGMRRCCADASSCPALPKMDGTLFFFFPLSLLVQWLHLASLSYLILSPLACSALFSGVFMLTTRGPGQRRGNFLFVPSPVLTCCFVFCSGAQKVSSTHPLEPSLPVCR